MTDPDDYTELEMMRQPPGDNWAPTLPPEDRERYRKAWLEYRCCRDCREWACDQGDDMGACTIEKYAALMTPEDYTCDKFQRKK